MSEIEPMSSEPSRRVILGTTAVALCAFCTPAQAQVGVRRRKEPATTRATGNEGEIDAGPITAFARDGVYDGLAKSRKLLIVRAGDRLHAASARCTHRNCVVQKTDDEREPIRCPCHGSTFDREGIPLDGEATTSLPRFAIRVASGRVLIDASRVFDERDWGDAAASVTIAR